MLHINATLPTSIFFYFYVLKLLWSSGLPYGLPCKRQWVHTPAHISALSQIHVLTFEIPIFTMKEDIVRKPNAKQFDGVHIVPNLYEIYGPSCLVLKGAVPSCGTYICPIDTFIIKIRRSFLDTILYKHG